MWQALRICEIILVRKSRILIVWYCLRNTIYCFWFEHIIFIFHNSFHTVFVHSETRNWKNKLVKKFNLKKIFPTHFFVITFLPFTKVVEVEVLLTLPPPPPPPSLNVARDVKPFIPPNDIWGVKNASSISENPINGLIIFCAGCELRWWCLCPFCGLLCPGNPATVKFKIFFKIEIQMNWLWMSYHERDHQTENRQRIP